MLSSKKESSSSCHTDDSMQNQVELEIGSSGPSIQQVPVDASESTDENNSEEKEYFIARDRPRS